MDNAEMCQVGGGINKIASMLIRRAGGFKAVWYLKQIPWDVYAARIMGRKFQMGPRDFKKFTHFWTFFWFLLGFLRVLGYSADPQ